MQNVHKMLAIKFSGVFWNVLLTFQVSMLDNLESKPV